MGKAKGGRVNSADVTDRISTAEEMEGLTKELNSGAYGLDAEGNVLYKKTEGIDAASDRPTKTPQDTIADIEPSAGSIAQTEEAVNEVEMLVKLRPCRASTITWQTQR